MDTVNGSDSSDSEDDIRQFDKIFSKRSAGDSSDSKPPEDFSKKKNRLDDLLAEHIEETASRQKFEEARKELLADLERGFDDDIGSHSQDIASEYEGHIEQLDVKSSEPLVQPGLQLFNRNQFSCLYSECTSPFAWGFTPSKSAIDKMVASTEPNMLTNLLLSKALVTCASQLSDVNSVLMWLLNIVAVHHCPVTVYSCYNNLIGILHQFQIKSLSKGSKTRPSWCPHPLTLVRTFVNLGACSQDLVGEQQRYTQEDLSKYLTVENYENDKHHKNVKGHACGENIQMVFKVIATALETQPDLCKEDLNQMFFMLSKVELDTVVKKSISLETQECFSAILQCYSDGDWPTVVPGLCRLLREVSDHHRNQFHLADLLPGTTRGSFLKVRLSFICLRALLLPGADVSDKEILDFKLADIGGICCTKENPAGSSLAVALQSLLARDMYKMMSAIKFLDLCAGDGLYRSTQPVKSLEHLISQADIVIHSIRDKISVMDLSKIKDTLSTLKFKWSLALQDHPSNQRSILPWISHTGREMVNKKVLKDNCSLLSDEIEEDL